MAMHAGVRGLEFLYPLVVREQKRVHLRLLRLVKQVPTDQARVSPTSFVQWRVRLRRRKTMTWYCAVWPLSRLLDFTKLASEGSACNINRLCASQIPQHPTAQAACNARVLSRRNGRLQLAF
jgi:hypothetical protein